VASVHFDLLSFQLAAGFQFLCQETEIRQIPWLLVRKRTIPIDDRLISAKLVPTFCGYSALRGQSSESLRSLISAFLTGATIFSFK
jgi:hypothetical protein